MARERWWPLREMAVLTEATSRLLEEPVVSLLHEPGTIGTSGMDLYEQDTTFVLEVALPGVAPDQLDISVAGNCVTISGEVPCEIRGRERVTYLSHERPCGSIREVISLPTDVDVANTQATFENGILRLTLPKAAAVRPRRIEIQAGAERRAMPQVQQPARAQPAQQRQQTR